MEFGPKFKELLEKHGVSQSKFAIDTNTNTGLVSRYLKGKESPSADFIFKAISYFPGTDTNYLFSDVLEKGMQEPGEMYIKEPNALDIINDMKHNLKRLEKIVSQKWHTMSKV